MRQILFMCRWLVLGVLAVCSARAGAQFSPSSPSSAAAPGEQSAVWVIAQDYSYTGIGNVAIRCAAEGQPAITVVTPENGHGQVTGLRFGQALRAWVDDPKWYSLDGVLETQRGGDPLIFRVFSRDDSSLNHAQRLALLQAKIDAIVEARDRMQARQSIGWLGSADEATSQSPRTSAANFATSQSSIAAANASANAAAASAAAASEKAVAKAAPASLAEANPLSLEPSWNAPSNMPFVAFAAGLRTESPDTGDLKSLELPTTHSLAVATRVLGGRGEPLRDVLINLMSLGPAPAWRVRPVDRERTDSGGGVRFESLAAGQWYRIEVADGEAAGVGRSTVFRLEPGKVTQLRPLVVRPLGKALCGFVLRERGPAEFARIDLMAPGGGFASLTTLADEHGYFSLGPLPEGMQSADLQISHASRQYQRALVKMTVENFDREILVPLDALGGEKK